MARTSARSRGASCRLLVGTEHGAHPFIGSAAVARCSGTGDERGRSRRGGCVRLGRAGARPRTGRAGAIRETPYRTVDAIGSLVNAGFTLYRALKCDKAGSGTLDQGAALGAMMLNHARNMSDLPEAEDGPADGPPSSGPPAALDPETARGLFGPYLRNSQKARPSDQGAERQAQGRRARQTVSANAMTNGNSPPRAGSNASISPPDLAEDIGSRRWFRRAWHDGRPRRAGAGVLARSHPIGSAPRHAAGRGGKPANCAAR